MEFQKLAQRAGLFPEKPADRQVCRERLIDQSRNKGIEIAQVDAPRLSIAVIIIDPEFILKTRPDENKLRIDSAGSLLQQQ